jgi:hypothetical protein
MTEHGGGHLPNGGDGNGGASSTEQEKQYNLLGNIQILSFTASPPQVTPFEPTTLSWNVKLPTTHVPISIVVAGHTSNATSGSAVVAPVVTAEYGLTAKTEIISRMIGALIIPVDDTVCKSNQIYEGIITSQIKQAIADQFQGSSSFSLGSGEPEVSLSDATLSIHIELNLDVPDWFNATMTIAIQIEVGMQGRPPQASVLAQVNSTNVDVSWEWYSTLLSLGITSAVADGMQKIAQAFMSEIARNQIAAGIADELSKQIKTLATEAQQSDPERRAYTLTSLTLSGDGINFTVCPEPGPSTSPV